MTTRQPLTEAEKDYLAVRRAAGATYRDLAQELHCAFETVRKHARRQRDHQVTPRPGRPARGILSTYPIKLVERAVALKRAHPHWGPANVRLELKQSADLTTANLPSRACLSALFKDQCPEAVQPHRHQHYSERPGPRAGYAHQRGQRDAKEKIPLENQTVTTVLNGRDPLTALMIASQALVTTTAHGWRKLTLPETQRGLARSICAVGLSPRNPD